MGMGVEINEVPLVVGYLMCPSCGKEVKIIDLEPLFGRKRLYCPYCGADLEVDGHFTIAENFASKGVNCPSCDAHLELKVSSFPHNNTEQYCPLCGAAAC